MTKENLVEANLNDKQKEQKTPFSTDDNLYYKQIKPVAKPQPKLGIDVDKEFYDTLVAAAQNNKIDIGKLESFSHISQNRNTIYQLIDTMAEDSTVAAILETYAEDATETNTDGRIVWAEALDPNIAKYVTYLLDTMNVDKNAYKWIYSLIKYGDLYLRLYRESEYNDKLFDNFDDKEAEEKHKQSKLLNEELSKIMEADFIEPLFGNNQDILNESIDDISKITDSNKTDVLNEDINVRLYGKNDRYVHYLEMVPNPAEVYELTRLGKSYAYIQAPVMNALNLKNDVLNSSGRYTYRFKKRDVDLFEATEFVHAMLEDNSSRVPEEVDIFLTDADYDTQNNALSYTVRRGQSLLYNTYKIWRELTLLEYALLLNRVTKSSIVRIIGVEVGDMPKEQIGPHLQGIKSLMEQKASLDVGGSMTEYTNPGPVENNIYVPTHEGVGAISTQQIGGDVDVNGLADIDYFKNKFFGSLRVPKQYFGDTDDSTGFNGGTSLSIISSRYAKTIKRIQNTFVQSLTDAVNLMLLDKGLTSYVNKFELHMVPPTTQEEIDRQDNMSSKISIANDVMLLVGDIKDLSSRLQILKSLMSNAVPDPTIGEIIQKEIDRLEELKNAGIKLDETGEPIIEEDDTGLTGSMGGELGGSDWGSDSLGGDDFSGDTETIDDLGGDDMSADLPTPDSMGLDLTDNDF